VFAWHGSAGPPSDRSTSRHRPRPGPERPTPPHARTSYSTRHGSASDPRRTTTTANSRPWLRPLCMLPRAQTLTTRYAGGSSTQTTAPPSRRLVTAARGPGNSTHSSLGPRLTSFWQVTVSIQSRSGGRPRTSELKVTNLLTSSPKRQRVSRPSWGPQSRGPWQRARGAPRQLGSPSGRSGAAPMHVGSP
jgi:hypothetical protein